MPEREETPQAMKRRFFVGKKKVQHKPTRAQKAAFKRLVQGGNPPVTL